MIDTTKFSGKLVELLNESGFSEDNYELFYNEYEFPKSSFYDWLSAKCFPSFENSLKLANNFKCSLDYLFGKNDIYYYVYHTKLPSFSTRLKFLYEKYDFNTHKLYEATRISRNTIYS